MVKGYDLQYSLKICAYKNIIRVAAVWKIMVYFTTAVLVQKCHISQRKVAIYSNEVRIKSANMEGKILTNNWKFSVEW